MPDSYSSGTEYDGQEAPSTPAMAAAPLLSIAHVLAERITAMTYYFAAARAYLRKGDVDAAEQCFLRFLEQSDRTREIAEQVRAFIHERLP